MASKEKIYLEYKYPDQPWKEYDHTMVPAWAERQEAAMKSEHPMATWRKRVGK